MTVNETIERPIPSILMTECDAPIMRHVKTNADLVGVLSRYIEAFEACRTKHIALVTAIQKEK